MRTEPHARSHTGARDEGTRKGNEGSRDRRPGGKAPDPAREGSRRRGRASGPGAWAGRAGGDGRLAVGAVCGGVTDAFARPRGAGPARPPVRRADRGVPAGDAPGPRIVQRCDMVRRGAMGAWFGGVCQLGCSRVTGL
ncbi:hypothetical protein GCM10010499_17280 [Streptomyces thermoviolaceus subsp. apingens]|nr:hypothetical protein GCM10010499_17280 [Streptomyces thermoviolaceus subsp. apingens]